MALEFMLVGSVIAFFCTHRALSGVAQNKKLKKKNMATPGRGWHTVRLCKHGPPTTKKKAHDKSYLRKKHEKTKHRAGDISQKQRIGHKILDIKIKETREIFTSR